MLSWTSSSLSPINCYIVEQRHDKFWGRLSSSFSEWKETLLLIPAIWHSTLSPLSPWLKEKAKKKKKSYFPTKNFNYKALLSDGQSGVWHWKCLLPQELFSAQPWSFKQPRYQLLSLTLNRGHFHSWIFFQVVRKVPKSKHCKGQN